MNVSIIICTCNRAAHLRETLCSLSCVNVPAGMICETVVVDNASSDNTWEVASSFPLRNMPLRVIHELRRGQSQARNTGLEAASGEIILFTDDDLRFPAEWLEAMCRPIQSGEAEAVAGLVSLAPHLVRPWMEPVHRYWLAETDRATAGSLTCMIGANMAFSRKVLEKVPGFDTNLGPGALGFSDDTLFSKQLWVAGFKIVYANEGQVVHHFQPDRLTRTSLLEAARKRGETKAYVLYHWEHRAIIAPAAQMARKRLQVSLWRRHHPHESAAAEGLPTGEMYNLEAYHCYRHYLIERRKPRLYDKHGLRKRSISTK